jgi:hypothetical protein
MIAAFMAGYMGKTAYRPPIVQEEAKRDFLETGPLSPEMLRARPNIEVRLDDIEKQHKKDQLGVNLVLGLGLPILLAMHLAANPTVRQWVKRKYNSILGPWEMDLGIPDMTDAFPPSQSYRVL